ncbi:MAG: TonB-dependent siderophore receptor [Acidobacteria bacterium]|nr:TonB-dependent siderophore receptor [Acidobacteriota bacterium]
MTRKALRKRRQQVPPKPPVTAHLQGSPWITVGTLLASTALTGFHPASARARTLSGPALPVFGAFIPGEGQSGVQVPATYRFDIAPGSFGDVLGAFERVTGIRVTLAIASIETLQSPGASGVFTAEQALRALVHGTSLQFHITSPTSATLDLAALSESVDVTARLPVSSPKYTQPLRDTPQTLVVIPEAVLQDQGAITLRDALRNTPGITLTAGEGGAAPGDNILIRGFSARNDVYIDGARDPGVISRDTFNIEAVEVTKGPSSVTAGRGSTGGSVNLVTKSANLRDSSEVRLSGGNADQKRGTIDMNRRLSDTMAVRMNGMWQNSGVPGRDDVKSKGWGFAPSIGFGLGRPTTVNVEYQRLEQDNIPDYGLPATLPGLAVTEGKTVDDLDFSNFYGLVSRDHEKVTSDLVTTTVEHRFGSRNSIRNLTRYGRNSLDRVVTPPRAATAANAGADPGYDPSIPQIRRTDTKYQYRDDRTIANQTDVTTRFATGSVGHSAVVGVELAHDRQPSHAATDLFTYGRPPVTDLFHPDPTQAYQPAIAGTGATSEARSTSVAAYAFDTVKLSDTLQADLGIRWDRIDVDYTTVSVANVKGQFGRTDQAASGRAGIVYKPVTRGSVYAAYSTSFNPSFDGSFGLTLSGTGANNAALPPERSRNIEIGTKWDVTPGLFATVAAFRTEKVNAKTTDASTGATILAGDQQVTGIEFGLSGNLTSRWSVFSGLSLMDGKIEESLVAAEVDKRLSYVPETSFNIWSTYRLPMNLSIGGGAQFTGGYYFNNSNTASSANAEVIQRLTRYWLFNAMLSQRINKHLDLQMNMNNLSDERYVERGYTGHFSPGPSRSIVVGPVITF